MVAPPGGRQGERQAAKGRAGRGGTGRGSGGLSTRERNLNALDALRGGVAQNLDPKTGKSLGPKGGAKQSGLPSTVNPLKYTQNPTPTAPLTLENVGTLISNVNDIANPMGSMLKAGLGRLGVPGFDEDPLSGFEGPIGETTRGDYQGSDIDKPDDLGPLVSPAPKKKKTPAKPPGFTLLEGAGGSLLGS